MYVPVLVAVDLSEFEALKDIKVPIIQITQNGQFANPEQMRERLIAKIYKYRMEIIEASDRHNSR